MIRRYVFNSIIEALFFIYPVGTSFKKILPICIVNVVQHLIKDDIYTFLSSFLLRKLLSWVSTTSRISPFDESLIKWHSQWGAWFMIFDSSKGFKNGLMSTLCGHRVINEQFLQNNSSELFFLIKKNAKKSEKFWKILKISKIFWKFWKILMILDVENRLGKLDSGSFLTNNDFGQKFS